MHTKTHKTPLLINLLPGNAVY